MNLFNKIDLVNESLIRKLLKKYALKISEKLKHTNLEYYNEGLNFLKSIDNTNPEVYFEFLYEDFLILFCSIINYYTKLDLKLEFEGNTIELYMHKINLKDALNLDSINLVDLIALVQFTYKITIPVEDLKNIHTFNDLYDYIEQHQK